MVAYHQLQERLPDQSFSFFFAPSHPNYRAPDGPPTEVAPVSDIGTKPIESETGSTAEDSALQATTQRAA